MKSYLHRSIFNLQLFVGLIYGIILLLILILNRDLIYIAVLVASFFLGLVHLIFFLLFILSQSWKLIPAAYWMVYLAGVILSVGLLCVVNEKLFNTSLQFLLYWTLPIGMGVYFIWICYFLAKVELKSD